MFLFGITGGIGSGKSAVCHLLQQKGVPIIAADPLAKELTHRLPEIRTALTTEFGTDVYSHDGHLNKDKLSEIVFSDPQARERVNAIIHPHVLKWIREEARRLAEEEQQQLIGVEAALIYESGMEKMLDAVVVVTAPLEKRLQWLEQRDRLPRQTILQRVNAQMPIAEKIQRADYVIENDGSLTELADKVEALYNWLVLHVY
jgi:dephospho-CoA kinase